MNRARIILIVLSVYIFAAFGWWTYAHCNNSRIIYLQQKDVLEMRCYKATFDIQGAINQDLFEDTLGLSKFFGVNYPDLEVVYVNVNDPLNNFMVRPTLQSYQDLESLYNRKLSMYIAEGIVMIILLLWGMFVIFRSFRKELFLKKLQANFLLSITHELKTPVTAIKLYMETLMKRNIDADQIRTIADNSLQETKRLQDLVEKLLLSAQLESHKYTLEKQSINLSELVNEILINFNNTRPDQQKIEAIIQDQVIINGDPSALEMIINNLLSNGLKYGGANSLLKVTLYQANKETTLSISDEGEGISDEDKKLLFNKFYRIGDENTRKTKGTGLGLFIVKNLVTLHGGIISVKDIQPKGTIFKIKLHSDAE